MTTEAPAPAATPPADPGVPINTGAAITVLPKSQIDRAVENIAQFASPAVANDIREFGLLTPISQQERDGAAAYKQQVLRDREMARKVMEGDIEASQKWFAMVKLLSSPVLKKEDGDKRWAEISKRIAKG